MRDFRPAAEASISENFGEKCKVASKLQLRNHRKFCMKMFCEMAFLKQLFVFCAKNLRANMLKCMPYPIHLPIIFIILSTSYIIINLKKKNGDHADQSRK
jgi:hypothetical protein